MQEERSVSMEILLIGCNPIVATSRGAVDNSSSPPQTISWRRSPKLRNNTEHPQERFCADKSASTPVNAMKAKCGSERSHSLVSPIRTVSFTSDERNSSREITSLPDILCLHLCTVVAQRSYRTCWSRERSGLQLRLGAGMPKRCRSPPTSGDWRRVWSLSASYQIN